MVHRRSIYVYICIYMRMDEKEERWCVGRPHPVVNSDGSLLFSYLRWVTIEPRNKRQKTGYLFRSIVFRSQI